MKEKLFRRSSTPPTANVLKFDVMLSGRFVCTMQMPLGLPVAYNGDTPVFEVRSEQIESFVESRRPSLKDKNYTIEFDVRPTRELWRS